MDLFRPVTKVDERARLFAAIALHSAQEYSGEYALLLQDHRSRKLWKMFAAKEQRTKAALKDLELKPDLKNMIVNQQVKDIRKGYEEELLRMAKAVKLAVEKGQYPRNALKGELARLWRDAKFPETKKILEEMVRAKVTSRKPKGKDRKKNGKRY